MYLSRVEIDSNNRKKIKDLTHVGAFHNWVEQSFPEEINLDVRSRKLWRIDNLSGKNYLIVLSLNKPDINALEKYGVDNSGITKSYTNYIEKINIGSKMRFRIALNPTISVSIDRNKRGKVKQIIGTENQMNYLKNRSEKHGFSIEDDEFYIVGKSYQVLKKQNLKDERFLKVEYEGILTITDLSLFKELLTKGIGRKKAYGCGLMTVMPLE